MGQAVTVSASVTAGATGKVTFYDGMNILGISTLSNSVATVTTTLLPSGTRSLRAYFQGDLSNAPAGSTTLPLTVTAAVSVGLRAPVKYSTDPVTAGVVRAVAVADFNGDLKPDVAVANQGNGNVGILLGNGDGTFKPPVTYSTGASPIFVAVGDWNMDGFQDLALLNFNSAVITLMMGNGDGTFQPRTTITLTSIPTNLVIADFNGDGKPDLAAVGPGVQILLGKGDGTFQNAVAVTTLTTSVGAAVVGDFNGDGKADLALGGSASPLVILFGKGDGTFNSPATISAFNVGLLAVADLNNDGKSDLVTSIAGYSPSNYPYAFLGRGDGSFQAPIAANLNFFYTSGITTADLYGDGKVDLLLWSEFTGTTGVTTLPGNNDGTFRSPISTLATPQVTSLVVADFNGDGKSDILAATADATSNVAILLGGAVPDLTIAISHGNGFTQGQSGAFYKLTVSNVGDVGTAGVVGVSDHLPASMTATSISGTGWSCTLATLSCTRSDTLPVGSSYPPIVINLTAGSQTGSVTNTATVSGGGDASTGNNSASDTVNVRTSTTVALTSSPNPSNLGQAMTLTATLGAGTGKVTFYDGSSILGVATISAGQATFTTSALASGSRSLTARFDGDTNFGPVLSAVRTQTVNVLPTNGFTSNQTFRTGIGASATAVADFNRDGKLDVVTANSADVSLLLGNGDSTFQAPVSYGTQTTGSTSAPVTSVVTGDFNGDGKPDLAIAYSSSLAAPANLLAILLGNGDGTFQSAVYVTGLPADNAYKAIATADIDRDGIADLFLVSSQPGFVVLLGNGDGTFQAPITNTTINLRQSLWALSDMNGDGKLDLVSADSGNLLVSLGNGDGTFQPALTGTATTTSNVAGIVTGDFNGDGKTDVVVVYWVGLITLKGNGDGTFQAGVVSTNLSGLTVAGTYLVAGDFNGDGRLDVAYSQYSGPGVTLAFGNGDGTFGSAANIQAGQAGGIAIGDFNGDGRPDLVAANTAGQISVLAGGGISGLGIVVSHSGTFTAAATATYQVTITNLTYAATSGTASVLMSPPASLNILALSGTGWNCTLSNITCTRADGLITGNSYPPINVTVLVSYTLTPSIITNSAFVYYNGLVNSSTDSISVVYPSSTALTVSPAATATLGQLVTLTASIGAVNGAVGPAQFFDGATFLGSSVVAAGQATLTTRLLPAGQHTLWATFAGDTTHSASSSPSKTLTVTASPTSGLSAPVNYSTGKGPNKIVAGDFNKDGKTDLATLNATAKTVSILLGNGDGTFQAKTDYTVGTLPVAIVVGDFNGDGNADIIVANQTDRSLSVLLGTGNGTLLPASTIVLDTPPLGLNTADFDRDGKLDLAVTLSSGDLRLLPGNGDGTFRNKGSAGVHSPNLLGIVDFNSDGKADFAIGFFGSLYTYLGNGDGTFQTAGNANAGNNTTAVAFGDLNGDGVTDLVFTDGVSIVNVLLCRADGTCATAVSYPAGTSPVAVTLADVDGDGKLDVVAVNSGGNTISVLLGKGDGTLQAQTTFTVGSSPQGIVAGDFNSDGRTDLAVVNSLSDSVTVVLGTLASTLQVTSTHSGNFLFNQSGATYTLTVTNSGPAIISDTVTVVDTLPAGLNATAMGGAGWTCTLATLTCTQTASLAVGASYQPITLVVNVTATSAVTNLVTASSPSSVPAIATDPTDVSALPPPVIVSPLAGQTGVSVATPLTWNPAAGATSYDVYFGTSAPPPLVTSVAGTSYTPPTALALGTVYYWRIVARNAAGSASSPTASFITAAAPSYTGKVESATCSAITGYAADRSRLNQSINIRIYEGINLLLDAPANVARPDIGAQLGDNGAHGFTWPGSSAWAIGSTHTIQVRFESSTTQLTGSPLTVTCGASTVPPSRAAVYRNGTWVIDNGNFNWDGATTDFVTTFGLPGDTPITGDWDGSGKTKIGVYRNGEWFLDTNGNGVYDAGVDQHGFFGGTGDIPVVGDWDGNGKTKIGVFRRGAWILDTNGNMAYDAGVDKVGSFGAPTDVPVVGDWTGDKKSKVGVYRGGVWLLDTNGNVQFDPGVDTVGSFGAPTDVIVLGDWTGSGTTKVGVYRNGAWVLDMNGNANWDPATDLVGSFGGGPTDRPVVGDWDGSGRTKIGIYRDGVWILDLTNTALYNPATVRIGSFGIPSDVPLTGKWSKP